MSPWSPSILTYGLAFPQTNNTFCKNLINIKKIGPELPPTDTNRKDRKSLYIQFVVNDMKDSTTAIFTDGSSLINPGPPGPRGVTFRAGMNEPPIKLAKAVP